MQKKKDPTEFRNQTKTTKIGLLTSGTITIITALGRKTSDKENKYRKRPRQPLRNRAGAKGGRKKRFVRKLHCARNQIRIYKRKTLHGEEAAANKEPTLPPQARPGEGFEKAQSRYGLQKLGRNKERKHP